MYPPISTNDEYKVFFAMDFNKFISQISTMYQSYKLIDIYENILQIFPQIELYYKYISYNQ